MTNKYIEIIREGRRLFVSRPNLREGDEIIWDGGPLPCDMTENAPALTRRAAALPDHLTLEAVAYHEAGHAVRYLSLGFGFRYLSLRPRTTGAVGIVMPPRRTIKSWDLDAVLIAGPAAELAYMVLDGIGEAWTFRFADAGVIEQHVMLTLANNRSDSEIGPVGERAIGDPMSAAAAFVARNLGPIDTVAQAALAVYPQALTCAMARYALDRAGDPVR